MMEAVGASCNEDHESTSRTTRHELPTRQMERGTLANQLEGQYGTSRSQRVDRGCSEQATKKPNVLSDY